MQRRAKADLYPVYLISACSSTLWLLAFGHVLAGADELQELRQLMADSLKVKIEHEEKFTPSIDNKPPFKSESWTFCAGVVRPVVRYARYLNLPPDYTGNYPSLPNSDTGIGLDGGAFGNWYRGNALRVLINDRDILAVQPAAKIECHEGENGHLRLIWQLEDEGSLVFNFVVPDDAHAVYLRIDISPVTLQMDSLKISLTCYPGGFGPYYGLPSHRWVRTSRNQAEVPKDYGAKEFPKVPFAAKDAWVFYADRHEHTGSLGLVILPEEHPSGEIQMSNYGIATTLNYPSETRQIHLGLYAYSIVNECAQKQFINSARAESEALRRAIFWPESNTED